MFIASPTIWTASGLPLVRSGVGAGTCAYPDVGAAAALLLALGDVEVLEDPRLPFLDAYDSLARH